MTATDTTSPPVLSAAQLAQSYGTNTRWIATQCAGLTHADSLLQPAVRGNCLNWVVGHIAVHRDYILQALGQPKVLGDAILPTYDRGSAPILVDGPGVLPLETLLDAIAQSQTALTEALTTISAEHLTQQAFDDGPQSVATMVTFLFWHESYHTGQTEYLRQLAGTDDQIIK